MAATARIEKNISFHTSRHSMATLSLAAEGDHIALFLNQYETKEKT